MAVAIPGWTLGTLGGGGSGNLLPDFLVSALSVAIYGMFLAVIIPPAKKNRAVYDPIAALKAGNDLNMPGITADPEKVVQAVEAGELTEEELDRNVARVLELMDTYGSPECYDMSAQYIMDMSKQAAYKAACEGIVLLKNENGIFPIRSKGKAGNDSVFETVSDEEVMSGVVLCGSGAIRLYDCGTGSAGITTDKDSSIYEGLIQNGVEVSIGIPAAGKRFL